MQLAFESKELRSICEDRATAVCELGTETADVLRHRLADLYAAVSIADLIAGNPRIVEANGMSCLIIDLCHGHLLVLKANHIENPLTESGQIAWGKVSRIMVTRIGGKT